METKMTEQELQDVAEGIWAQCRAEYPGCVEEAVWDMCEAVILADGLDQRSADVLRDFCGI